MKNKIIIHIKKVINFYVKTIAILATIFILLAFTDIPYHAYHALSLKDQKLQSDADLIVLMGGDGMPSPNNLMRIYFTIKAAKENKNAKIIIAMPFTKDNSAHQLKLMAKELYKNNIDSNRIFFEYKGYNTRTQAIEISKMFSNDQKVIIVSTPEHMFRAIKTFEKVGFKFIGSNPTFERPPSEEILQSTKKNTKEVQNLTLRYNLWSYMQYEIRVLREYIAIGYYWYKGWI